MTHKRASPRCATPLSSAPAANFLAHDRGVGGYVVARLVSSRCLLKGNAGLMISLWSGDADTEPRNASQTPLPQRINGLPPLPCVLTCVLKPQSHCSYPQANMGCRSRQTSRGTVLRNDRPRRVRAAQRCPTEFISLGCICQSREGVS